LPVVKPAQRLKRHKNKSLNKENKNMERKQQYERSVRAKALNPKKT